MHTIKIRNLEAFDVGTVARLHSGAFPFPDLSNLLYASKKVAIVEDEVIAAGLCRLTSEGILILDRDQPATVKVRVVRDLLQSMADEVVALGMDECMVFADSPEYAALLVKKLGFEPCTGIPLVVSYAQKRT